MHWDIISFLQLAGGVREGGQNAGEAKGVRVSQVSSGVGVGLGCGCFGESHQRPSGFEACRIEAVQPIPSWGAPKQLPSPVIGLDSSRHIHFLQAAAPCCMQR